jgi:hypothetical protein
VPPSTRENPFPPAEAMAPLRQADRLGRDIDEMATAIRGLPLLPEDKVWDRVRRGGLDDLLQFDWSLVGDAQELASVVAAAADLSAVDSGAVQDRLRGLKTVIADRRSYLGVIA